MSAQRDWHPGTGDGHRLRANTTGGKSQRGTSATGDKGRPNFLDEVETLRDERERERDEDNQRFEDFDAGRHYAFGGGGSD